MEEICAMKQNRRFILHKIWLALLVALVAVLAAAPLGGLANASDETDPLQPEESAVESTEETESGADNDEPFLTFGVDTEPPNSPAVPMAAHRHCDGGDKDSPSDNDLPDTQATVTFLYNYLEGDEDIYLRISVYINETTAPPPLPRRPEYTFDGWYQEAACENAWDFENLIREDLLLYARWQPIPPTLPGNTGGETGGNTVVTAPKASKSGHTGSTSTKDPVVDLRDWGIGADVAADSADTPPAPTQAVADSGLPAPAATAMAGTSPALVEDTPAAAVPVSMDTAQAPSSRVLVLPTAPLSVISGNTGDGLLINEYLGSGTVHMPVVNMSLALYSSVVGIVLAITLLIPRPGRSMADTIWRLFAIATGAVTAVSCLLTQSPQNNVDVVDRWTIFGVVMCVAQLSFVVIMRLVYRENRPHPKDTAGKI